MPLASAAMMLLVLIVACVLFLALYWQLARRLGAVEAELRALRQGSAVGAEASAGAERLPAAPVEPPERQTLGALFEQLVGGRMLIWIGGVALVVAGFFLIRHSIEIGLVTPEMRMVAAGLFGLALLGAGEYARGGRLLADDPRIAQALVGAGIAILYAAAYGSYFLYGLFGGATATALMLLVAAGALVLSLRHGAPTALMGLVGGFLTPWLVGDPRGGALPILAYLALLDAAIFALAWRRGWGWLAAGAVASSFLWTAYLVSGPLPDAQAAALFAAALAVIASLLRRVEGPELALMQPLGIGLIVVAMLVSRLDTGPEAWLLYLGLSAASLILSVRQREQRFVPALGLALALFLLAAKAATGQDPTVPWVAAAITLLFAGISIPLATRDRRLRTLTACAALVGPILIVRSLRPEIMERPLWGVTAAMLAIAALALLWVHRRRAGGGTMPDTALAAAGGTAALLIGLAGYDLVPGDFVSGAWLLASIALLLAGIRIPDKALRLAGLILLTATILKVFLLDAAALDGALRILSFLALGVVLIGLGRIYGTVLRAERKGAG